MVNRPGNLPGGFFMDCFVLKVKFFADCLYFQG